MDEQRLNPSQRGRDHSGADAPPPIVLRKGRERWIFRYAQGQEGALLARISHLARAGEAGLDWVDAAIISHEISRRIASRLPEARTRPNPPPRAGPPPWAD